MYLLVTANEVIAAQGERMGSNWREINGGNGSKGKFISLK